MGGMVSDRVTVKLDEKINVQYLKIGRAYYLKNKDAEIADEEIKELFDKVKQLNAEKNAIEMKYLAQQGKKKCLACECIVPLESRFCNMCGVKFDEQSMSVPEDEEENKASEEEKQPEPRVCEICGEPLEDDAVFCQNCGTKNELVK